MQNYQAFKRVNEVDETLSLLEDIEKQIDELFDELKQKLRNPGTPRSAAKEDFASFLAKQKYHNEWNKLEQYHAIKNLLQDFQEALMTEENLDAVLDEYKDKLKRMVRLFVTSQAIEKQPVKPQPKPSTQPGWLPYFPPEPTKTPKKEPEAVVEPIKEPEAVAKPPEPEAVVKPPEPIKEPEAVVKPPEPEETEDEKLMKLGAAVFYAQSPEEGDGKLLKDLTPEDIEKAMKWVKTSDIIKDELPNKAHYIQAAKAYLQAQADKSLKTQTVSQGSIASPALGTPPTKGTIPGTPPPHVSLNPTKKELKEMSPQAFKKWLPRHDKELVDSYEQGAPDQKWWTSKLRDEVIEAYFSWKKHRGEVTTHHHAESLQYTIDHYKDMLRQDNRPEFFLQEAARIPFSERVNFYKKKLRSFIS